MIRFASLLFVVFAAGCSSTPTYRPEMPHPPPANNPTPQPVVIIKEPCNDGKLYFCGVQPVGSIRGLIPPPTSAISCGRCIDDQAHGLVLAVWCKDAACKGADITDAHHVHGHLVGEMSAGKFTGRSVVLVTALGAFYGSLNSDGGYDYGLLKKSRTGETFIGKFLPDGSPERGVLIARGRSSKLVLKAGSFVNSKLDGFAYFYEDGAYTTMRCSAGNCSVYLRDVVKDQVKAVLDILLSEAIDNAFFQKPMKMAVLALLPKTDFVRDMERAYDAWGNVQTIQKIDDVLR